MWLGSACAGSGDDAAADDGTSWSESGGPPLVLPEFVPCTGVDAEPGPGEVALDCDEPLAFDTACTPASDCTAVTLAWQRCAPEGSPPNSPRWIIGRGLGVQGPRALHVGLDGVVSEELVGSFTNWRGAGIGHALDWGELISLHIDGSPEPLFCVSAPPPNNCNWWSLSPAGDALLWSVGEERFNELNWCEFRGLYRFDALGQHQLLDQSAPAIPADVIASGVVAYPGFSLALYDPLTGVERFAVTDDLRDHAFATDADVLVTATTQSELVRYVDGVETDRLPADGLVAQIVVAPMGDAFITVTSAPSGSTSMLQTYASQAGVVEMTGAWQLDASPWPADAIVILEATNARGELFVFSRAQGRLTANLFGADGTLVWQAELGDGFAVQNHVHFVSDDDIVVGEIGSLGMFGLRIER